MASIKKTIDVLNGIYGPLQERAVRIASTLGRLGADVDWGYFGGHTVDLDGEQVFEAFPIPVLTVKDVCDIGVDIGGCFIEGKLHADELARADLSRLRDYRFYIYGAEDYLLTLFDSADAPVSEIPSIIAASGEKEFFVCISFDDIPRVNDVVEVCAILRELGTHILLAPDDEGLECEASEGGEE